MHCTLVFSHFCDHSSVDMTIIGVNSAPLNVLACLRLSENHGYYVPSPVISRVSDIPSLVKRRKYIIMIDDVDIELRPIFKWVSLFVIAEERLLNL